MTVIGKVNLTPLLPICLSRRRLPGTSRPEGALPARTVDAERRPGDPHRLIDQPAEAQR